jgi:hypothetical protein
MKGSGRARVGFSGAMERFTMDSGFKVWSMGVGCGKGSRETSISVSGIKGWSMGLGFISGLMVTDMRDNSRIA